MMKRKLLIISACFLMVFGSVLTHPKKVNAYDLTWETVTDPKKMMIILAGLGAGISMAASETFNNNMESIYNALPAGAKTAIKVITTSGDNYMIPKTDWQQLAYDLYVTLGLKNLIQGDDVKLNSGSFSQAVINFTSTEFSGPYTQGFTWPTRTYTYTNSVFRNGTTAATSFNIGTHTITKGYDPVNGIWGNAQVMWQSDAPSGQTIIYQNVVSKPIGTMTAYCTAYSSHCSDPTRKVLMYEWTINETFLRLDSWNWSSGLYNRVGNRIYYIEAGLPPIWEDSLNDTAIQNGTLDFTLANPVNPSQAYPDINWGNAVPGDIDIYPDNVLEDNIYFGGANTDVIDLTPDIVTNPVMPDPSIITNPILDVMIHLPQYLSQTGDAINDFANGLVDGASGAIGATVGAIGGWIGNLVNGVQSALASILAYLGTMLTDIGALLAGLGAYLLNGLKDWLNSFLDFITDFINALKTIINFFGRLFEFLWNNFIRFLMLLYNTLFLGIFTLLSQFILGLKSLMAVLPTPLDDISYLMIDITVFLTMLSVIIKFLTNSKGKS